MASKSGIVLSPFPSFHVVSQREASVIDPPAITVTGVISRMTDRVPELKTSVFTLVNCFHSGGSRLANLSQKYND